MFRGGIPSPSDYYFMLSDGNRTYDIEEMSAGEQAVFPMLFEFVRQRIRNSIVLIDEIDLNLHPPLAQALLANGQVRLSSLQHELSLEQSAHRQAELAVSELETPPRIVGAAASQGMVHPASVVELPYVSLSVPVATPKVTPGPAAPPPTTTPTTSAPTAGGAGASTSGGTSNNGTTGAATGTGTTASTTTPTSTP